MQGTIRALEIIADAERDLRGLFEQIDTIALVNQKRVLSAFREHRVSEAFFVEKTGYGRNDPARDTIDKIFATIFESESACVRMQLVSGTHALACALLGNLKAGERMVCLTGAVYDTLEEVVGISGDEAGSLKNLGVEYIQSDVTRAINDSEALKKVLEPLLAPPTVMAYIQKSCGYSFEQRTLSNYEIRKIAETVKSINPSCIVMVDNCYGEFVEEHEPTALGADIVAGSMIKNPGGGLAISGGYVAGKKQLVERALNRITSPGIGGHLGLTYNQNRLILQGLFLAPSVVAQALKGAALFAKVFENLGYEVKPASSDSRYDIIQAIKLGSAEKLVAFCRALQKWSPVDAHVAPEPSEMQGYPDPVVMAGGTFIEGSTIELSADGPLRPPYAVFVQGGLSYLHVKCALEGVLELIGSAS
jgi:cystathionine beta-lyase family protein involved in aluminum resistance